MYAVIAAAVHAVVAIAAAFTIAPYSVQPIATNMHLSTLCLASAALSGLGLVSTATYLSKRIRPVSGAVVGLLCGALCSVMIGLAMAGIDFSLVLYLALLAPTLLAVLLATLLDRNKSGWQSRKA
ncbi:MAG: hypothetical protein ABIQ86_14665 [Steroidobacteraceae bacterium]